MTRQPFGLHWFAYVEKYLIEPRFDQQVLGRRCGPYVKMHHNPADQVGWSVSMRVNHSIRNGPFAALNAALREDLFD